MKRLCSIMQAANRETKKKQNKKATSTDDTQIPRPDLRFAHKKQQRSKQGKGPEPKKHPHKNHQTQGEVLRVVKN